MTEGPYDLILLDAEMPVLGGFQVAEQLQRGDPEMPRLALMITSTRIHAEMARCRRMGIDACMVKPIRHAELLAAIRGAPPPDDQGKLVASRAGATVGRPPSRVPANILLAEDNPANSLLVQTLLEKRGWRVVAVANGREALEALELQEYDLVLMDAQMPFLDGYEATRLLRRREAAGEGAHHTPVICVTAHAMRGDRERCLDAGMDDYLPKPIEAEDLYAMVERHLGESAVHATAVPPADLQLAVKRIQGDWDLFRRLAENYMAEYPERLQALLDEVRAENPDKVQRLAHGLKGMFAMFEANRARDTAVRIEVLARESKLAAVRPLAVELEGLALSLAEYLKWALGEAETRPVGNV